jgi:hypothetical protein
VLYGTTSCSHCLEFLHRTLAPVAEATWDGTNGRTSCHPGTRLELLDAVVNWAVSADEPRVRWLSGLAGTGKSTIARSLCERLDKEHRLGGSFFISRQYNTRRDAAGIVRTLAYLLSQHDSGFRAAVLEALRKDVTFAGGELVKQISRLIVEPLRRVKRTTGPLVLVMDAFDECDKDGGQEGGQLLPLLVDAICESDVPVKLIITSRPEQTIVRMLINEESPERVHREDLQAVNPANVQADIRLYLTDEMRRIALRQHLSGWPLPSDLDEVIRRTGVLFVYASTVIKFVGEDRFSPRSRLQVVLGTAQCKSNGAKPYEMLNDLYMQLLYTAVQKSGKQIVYSGTLLPEDSPLVDAELCRRLRIVIGSIVLLQEPVTPDALAGLLFGENEEESVMTTQTLTAVLLVEEGAPIRTLHPSFREFLLDNTRCLDPRFQINQGEQHLHLALGCLSVMNEHLRRDICRIGDPTLLNSEVDSLQDRINKIPSEVIYASKHWIAHVARAARQNLTEEGKHWMHEIKVALSKFCDAHLLHWMEATSCLDYLHSAFTGYNDAVKWCMVRHLVDAQRKDI